MSKADSKSLASVSVIMVLILPGVKIKVQPFYKGPKRYVDSKRKR